MNNNYQYCTQFQNRVSRRFDFLVRMWWMHYLPSVHFHTAMLCAASMPTVTRSLPLQLKFTAHTPLVWNPCMTDKVSLDVASHTWTQGSVPIWPVATMFCQTQHNLFQNVKSKTDSNPFWTLFLLENLCLQYLNHWHKQYSFWRSYKNMSSERT